MILSLCQLDELILPLLIYQGENEERSEKKVIESCDDELAID